MIQRFGLVLGLALSVQSLASDGYLAAQGQWVFNLKDKTHNASYGGWIMGGDEDTRAGAGGYKVSQAFDSPTYGNISFWGAGPMIFYVPDLGSSDVVVHIGGMFGGGLIQAANLSKQKLFWFLEPTVFAAFHLSSFFGIGVGGSFRYIPSLTAEGSPIDEVHYTFNANVSLILGDF